MNAHKCPTFTTKPINKIVQNPYGAEVGTQTQTQGQKRAFCVCVRSAFDTFEICVLRFRFFSYFSLFLPKYGCFSPKK